MDAEQKNLEKLRTELDEAIARSVAGSDPMYAYMGSLGVSPAHMMKYQESVGKIKEFEERNRS